MLFIDAFLSAAKSSLASCAVSLQTASTSTSSSSLDVGAEPLSLVPTVSTSSSASSLKSIPRKKARHALLKQFPLSESGKFSSLPNLGKAKGKNRMLEIVKDGLRGDKARSRRRHSSSVPATPPTSPLGLVDPLLLEQSSQLPASEASNSLPATFPCTNSEDVAMQDDDVDFAPSTRARCGSIVISAPKPLRASKRQRPLPTPPSPPTSPITSSPSNANPSSPATKTQNETTGWIDAPVSPPHFHSFVRHQADVYHTLINLSSATLSSPSHPGGYISYLRSILSEDASMAEALKVAEKQLMARLYFWLILRGAKAWIIPLDLKVPSSPSDSPVTPATPPGLQARTQQEDEDAMCVDMAAPPPSTVTSSPSAILTASPTQPKLIGDGAFASFSHMSAYLFHIRNQPRKRERGTPCPPSSPSSSKASRWVPTTSSPLCTNVLTSSSSTDPCQDEVAADHCLSSVAEDEDQREWLSTLSGMEAADCEMDDDDREWARLRFQMAMDIKRTSWSGVDPDFERTQDDIPPRPSSPAPNSPPRHSGTSTALLQACHESTSPPQACLPSELDKRPLPDSDSDSDSEVSPHKAPTWKRRRLSENEHVAPKFDERPTDVDQPPTKENDRAQMLRPARRLGSSPGARKPRSRGGVGAAAL